MNLIDYFNSFQIESAVYNFSANARSLYFAILGEFNRLQYPEEIVLPNAYLQKLSGIKSASVFSSARLALMNKKLIAHKSQRYKLLPIKTRTEKFVSGEKSDSANEKICRACSDKVAHAWLSAKNEFPFGFNDKSLAHFEQEYGVEKVVEGIRIAADAKSANEWNINYLRGILENLKKGVKTNDRTGDSGKVTRGSKNVKRRTRTGDSAFNEDPDDYFNS